MNIDLHACKLILADGIIKAKELGLTEDIFVDEGKTVYKYIAKFFGKHGAMPKIGTIKADTNVDLSEPTPENLSYYADKIVTRKAMTILGGSVKAVAGAIQAEHIGQALKLMREGISKTNAINPGRKAFEHARDGIDQRIKDQLALEDLHGMVDGYRTPWKELDEVTRGMHDGELWVLVAAKKTGKSWATILFLRKLLAQGVKPLLVSMEMPVRKLFNRFDALYAELGYRDFRSGLLGVDGVDRYVAAMKELSQDGDMWIAGNGLVKTPADVEILVQDLKPDIVLIDGVYLMQPSHSKWVSKYEKVSAVADELQPMAHRIRRPIFITTQFNRQLKEGALSGDSSKMGFAYELSQNADVVVGMFSDVDLKASRRMIWQIMEHREGEDFTFMTQWDLDIMRFSYIAEVQAEDLVDQSSKSKKSFTF